jgi:hypothetical protein
MNMNPSTDQEQGNHQRQGENDKMERTPDFPSRGNGGAVKQQESSKQDHQR